MVKQIPKGKQNLYNKIREYIILKNNLGHLGLEPRTIRLKAEYSTIELVTHLFNIHLIIPIIVIFCEEFNQS